MDQCRVLGKGLICMQLVISKGPAPHDGLYVMVRCTDEGTCGEGVSNGNSSVVLLQSMFGLIKEKKSMGVLKTKTKHTQKHVMSVEPGAS